MTDTDTTEKAKPAAAKTSQEPERTFHRDRLAGLEGARLAGCEPHELAGALALSDQRKMNFSDDELQKLVRDFRTHEVEMDRQEGDAR